MTSRHIKAHRAILLRLCTAAIALAAPAAHAADDAGAEIARLSANVQRLEDVRAVKRLQVSYSQYAQFGLWSQMAALFSRNGEAIYGLDDLKGRAAIAQFYQSKWGGGREGLPHGGVRAQFDDTPVVNLSADGKSAKGTWHEFATMGVYGGDEAMNGWGIGGMENEYVKENGVWKISRLHYFPFATGSYKDGWKTAGTVPYLPFHFTAANAPIVTPAISARMALPAISGTPATALSSVNKRIIALNDEDQIRNLQNAFGYYKDRKMWDDIVDLFTADAVLEDADAGLYDGPKGVRRWLGRMGPAGLKRGQLNEGVLFDMNVSLAPDGNSAQMRGLEWRELGDVDSKMARLGITTFVNSYAKGADGIWRIREMRLFPIALTDYYQGWNKSRIAVPASTGASAPDEAVPAADKVTDGALPIFFQDHPVTGKPVALPTGARVLAGTDLLPAPAAATANGEAAAADIGAAIADAQRRYSRSYAYDAVDNVTHAFGFFLVDNDFVNEGALYAADGWRGKNAVGFCVGPAHIAQCESSWGAAPLPHPRYSWGGRLMFQPVITVSDDGKFASEHTRLHSFSISDKKPGVLSGAMYNNQFKIVNGVWKADVISIEEPYWSSTTYEDGWASGKAPAPAPGRPAPGTYAPPPGALAPDVQRFDKLKIRFWGINNHPNPADTVLWPNIKPMWFPYKNPVTGRLPPNYCPNMKTCEKDLEASGHKVSEFH